MGNAANAKVNNVYNILGFQVKLTCPGLVWFPLIIDSKVYAPQHFAKIYPAMISCWRKNEVNGRKHNFRSPICAGREKKEKIFLPEFYVAVQERWVYECYK